MPRWSVPSKPNSVFTRAQKREKLLSIHLVQSRSCRTKSNSLEWPFPDSAEARPRSILLPLSADRGHFMPGGGPPCPSPPRWLETDFPVPRANEGRNA